MEGVLALMIPIVAVGGFFAWMLALSPVGKAFAEKLRGHKAGRGDAEGQEELLESVEQLRREVAELAERVDFTERLLGQQRGSERLGSPRP
jgi:aldehyde:ferredoxin oxidoreductase